MRIIERAEPLTPAEVGRLLKAGGKYVARTRAHEKGEGYEITLPDGYELRGLGASRSGQPPRVQRGHVASKPASAAPRGKSATSSGGSYFIKRLAPIVARAATDLKDHKISAGGATLQILRSLVRETGDGSAWEHCRPMVKELVDKLYLEHRKTCRLCLACDPEIGAKEFALILEEVSAQLTYHGARAAH